MLKNLAEPVEGTTSLMIDTQKLPARLAESEKKERMTSKRDCLFIPRASVTGMNAVDNLPAEAQIIIARFLLPVALKIEGAISWTNCETDGRTPIKAITGSEAPNSRASPVPRKP